jgi:hypothetical protein
VPSGLAGVFLFAVADAVALGDAEEQATNEVASYSS